MNGTAKKTDKVGAPKGAKRIRNRSFRVSPEGKRYTIPFPQRERVKQKYVAGKKLRQIAREEHITRTSVAKIVREPDVAQHVQDLREQWYGKLEIALQAAFHYIEHSKDGGKLAYEMLKDAKIIPTLDRGPVKVELQPAPEPESEESAIKRIAVAMVQGAIERHKYFGQPLEQADEIEEELREKEKSRKGVSE